MKKILFKWSELKATFWFIPVVIILFAVLLAIGLVYIDGQIDFEQEGLVRFFFVNSSDSARAILSTISGAMMGVAGTVFSITLVALTLASSQFGPRLIKKFMYVRLNQVVLGSYISTYLYCLLVLNSVRDANDYTFIPSISILVAIIAAIMNIVLLIIFIHQIAVSIQADHVVSDISGFISGQLKNLFPKKIGDDTESNQSVDPRVSISGYQIQISLKSPKSGYLQYFDSETLIEYVTKNNVLLELYPRTGAFLVEGMEIGVLFTNDNWDDDKIEEIRKQFVIGKTKTAQQDLEFSIHQMVEIASRALSTGVNDPFTATACIDNLTAIMCYLAQAKFPSKYHLDDEGNLRMIVDTLEFDGVLDTTFNQIRQFSAGSAAVINRLMHALITIDGFASKADYKNALIRHAEMVLHVGKETLIEKNDIQVLTTQAERILKN